MLITCGNFDSLNFVPLNSVHTLIQKVLIVILKMLTLTLFHFISLQFLFFFHDNYDVEVHKNEMSVQMEHFIIATVLLITGTEGNLNIVAKNISIKMNNKFRKIWNCITGVNTSFDEIHLESEEKTLIWFSLNE